MPECRRPRESGGPEAAALVRRRGTGTTEPRKPPMCRESIRVAQPQPPTRLQSLSRAVRLRCPACGAGPLFRGLLSMAPECGRCGYSYRREPGFYLGSIYINYGVTAVGTLLLYAWLVQGLGTSHEVALAVSLVAAVLFPVMFFRWARALLLGLDNTVNAQQSVGHGQPSAGDAAAEPGLTAGHMARLQTDDGNAGCLMGIVLVLVLLFGLGMAAVTLSFIASQPNPGEGESDVPHGRGRGQPVARADEANIAASRDERAADREARGGGT